MLKHIIKTFLLCALIMCPAPTAWYFDTITVLPSTVRDIIGFFGGIMWISLYSLPHVFNAIVLRSAVKKAKESAEKGDTVLLSPACTSFDAFKNFEERGNTFKNIVNSYK